MRYKLLGRSGLRVSELCLGTMTFGEDWGWGCSKDVSQQIFDAYAEAGGNFVDTANRYTNGTSERWLGDFIAADRDHFVVATKYTLFDKLGDPNYSGNHRKNMIRSLEASLKRLNTPYVDILYLHAWDFFTPIEEVMRALDDLVRAGKILYAAVSDTPAWIVARANTLAELRGWSPFVGLQIRYGLVDRTSERELIPMAQALDLAVLAWRVLGSGVLSGKYNRDEEADGRAAQWGIEEQDLVIASEVAQIAREIGCSPAQVAINWVRQQPGVMIPILGATKLSQIKDNLESLDHPLEAEHIARLNEISAIDLGFPHDMINGQEVRRLVTSDTYESIDNHRA